MSQGNQLYRLLERRFCSAEVVKSGRQAHEQGRMVRGGDAVPGRLIVYFSSQSFWKLKC
jgi:hypothetical protein